MSRRRESRRDRRPGVGMLKELCGGLLRRAWVIEHIASKFAGGNADIQHQIIQLSSFDREADG